MPAAQTFHELVQLALKLTLAFLKLLHRLGEFLRRHRPALLLAALLTLLRLALAHLARPLLGALALLLVRCLIFGAVALPLLALHPEGFVHHLLLPAHDLAQLVHLLAHLACMPFWPCWGRLA
jgi:hypothetical protein